ncbi:MAG: FKBP-type peptidyl-prolyl cis-trans isomerase [Ignavibacteriales bacterium]|nr:FKBP-type peptidyl-prolyl cis-trans isomerase [Ignavibacteriales bacterium]
MAASLVSCQSKVKKADLKSTGDKVSYSIGFDIGKNLRKNMIDVDAAKLLAGLKDGIKSDSAGVLADSEMAAVMQEFQKTLMEKQNEKRKGESDKNKKSGQAFLQENAKKEGITVLPSGLQYKVITSGSGKSANENSVVTTHYRGTLVDGTEFDNSYKRGEPAKFPVNGVIKGWTEALQLMKEGDKWMLYIPSELGYGDTGAGGTIPPGAALIFEFELISVEAPAAK